LHSVDRRDIVIVEQLPQVGGLDVTAIISSATSYRRRAATRSTMLMRTFFPYPRRGRRSQGVRPRGGFAASPLERAPQTFQSVLQLTRIRMSSRNVEKENAGWQFFDLPEWRRIPHNAHSVGAGCGETRPTKSSLAHIEIEGTRQTLASFGEGEALDRFRGGQHGDLAGRGMYTVESRSRAPPVERRRVKPGREQAMMSTRKGGGRRASENASSISVVARHRAECSTSATGKSPKARYLELRRKISSFGKYS